MRDYVQSKTHAGEYVVTGQYGFTRKATRQSTLCNSARVGKLARYICLGNDHVGYDIRAAYNGIMVIKMRQIMTLEFGGEVSQGVGWAVRLVAKENSGIMDPETADKQYAQTIAVHIINVKLGAVTAQIQRDKKRLTPKLRKFLDIYYCEKHAVLRQLISGGLKGLHSADLAAYNSRNQCAFACGAMETTAVLGTKHRLVQRPAAPKSMVWIFDGIYVSSEVGEREVDAALQAAAEGLDVKGLEWTTETVAEARWKIAAERLGPAVGHRIEATLKQEGREPLGVDVERPHHCYPGKRTQAEWEAGLDAGFAPSPKPKKKPWVRERSQHSNDYRHKRPRQVRPMLTGTAVQRLQTRLQKKAGQPRQGFHEYHSSKIGCAIRLVLRLENTDDPQSLPLRPKECLGSFWQKW